MSKSYDAISAVKQQNNYQTGATEDITMPPTEETVAFWKSILQNEQVFLRFFSFKNNQSLIFIVPCLDTMMTIFHSQSLNVARFEWRALDYPT